MLKGLQAVVATPETRGPVPTERRFDIAFASR
jgi:hypothetical protein